MEIKQFAAEIWGTIWSKKEKNWRGIYIKMFADEISQW